jgi:5-formyltetrahydrofolate cyclo-ligase
VATQNIIKFALKHGVKVYLPVILDQKNMAFYEIKSLKDVEKSSFKFKEPKENPERLLTSVKEVQAIFVPLVAFDKDLNRLGKGQGYYDR